MITTKLMDYNSEINQFIEDRYEFLLECANNITKGNRNVEGNDLISELTIHLLTNEEKVRNYIELDKLEAFCVSWMNIQGKYQTSPTNRKFNNIGYELDDYTRDNLPSDEQDHINTTTNEYERDLLKHFTEEQVNKIMIINDIIPYLTKSERILFDAYFIKDLSYDKIVQKYTFYREKDGKRVTYKSKKSIYNLMQGLKIKIFKLIDNGNI